VLQLTHSTLTEKMEEQRKTHKGLHIKDNARFREHLKANIQWHLQSLTRTVQTSIAMPYVHTISNLNTIIIKIFKELKFYCFSDKGRATKFGLWKSWSLKQFTEYGVSQIYNLKWLDSDIKIGRSLNITWLALVTSGNYEDDAEHQQQLLTWLSLQSNEYA